MKSILILKTSLTKSNFVLLVVVSEIREKFSKYYDYGREFLRNKIFENDEYIRQYHLTDIS